MGPYADALPSKPAWRGVGKLEPVGGGGPVPTGNQKAQPGVMEETLYVDVMIGGVERSVFGGYWVKFHILE